MNDSIEQISGYIEKIREYKAAIKKAIKDKYEEINSDGEEIDPGDDLSQYPSVIKDYLSLKFEEDFKEIGYKGIPEELLLTLQGQAKYITSSNKSDLGKSLFVGANFKGDLDDNRRCILLFTNSLKQYRAFNELKSLQEIYVVDDVSNLGNKDITKPENFIVTEINTYWLFRNTTRINHIYAILDMEDYGYSLPIVENNSGGTYFFTGGIYDGNTANVAQVPNLKTLYMKNIHRAYNFGNSPLSMDSVRYCINNALYDAEYAEKADGGCYKFTLKGSTYDDDARTAIGDALATRAAELSETGLNMEIVFSSN